MPDRTHSQPHRPDSASSRRALILSGTPVAGKSLAHRSIPIRTVPRAALEALVARLTSEGFVRVG